MNKKQKSIFLLVFLIILLFIINYSFLDSLLINFLDEKENAFVVRVIDGDTIEIENKAKVRFLGINTPEKNEPYYSEAKEFLEELVLNQNVELEFGKDKYDRYKRILAYIHLGNKNVNLELVKKGFANIYFPSGKDRHYEDFKKAWEKCVKEDKNLCEKSKDKCSKCIELKEFDYTNQKVIFYNKCNFDCDLTDWKIKDEGRKNFIFSDFLLKEKSDLTLKVGEGKNTNSVLYWKNKKYVWTKTGDTLFLRDKKDKLVLWRSY